MGKKIKLAKARTLRKLFDICDAYEDLGYTATSNIVRTVDGYIVMMTKVVDNA